jgi:hypothetical protein
MDRVSDFIAGRYYYKRFVRIQRMRLTESSQQNHDDSEFSFAFRAASALGISVIADGLDYVGAPIFALPFVGDIADLIVMGLLYRITKSKRSAFINAIEFIPFIGDFIPTYTVSTLMWILRESHKRKNQSHQSRRETITLRSEPSSTEIMGVINEATTEVRTRASEHKS